MAFDDRKVAGAQAEALTAGSRVLHITSQIDREFMDRDRAPIHDPDVMVALTGFGAGTKKAVHHILKRNMGVKNPDRIQIEDMKAYQLLRDNGLFLET